MEKLSTKIYRVLRWCLLVLSFLFAAGVFLLNVVFSSDVSRDGAEFSTVTLSWKSSIVLLAVLFLVLLAAACLSHDWIRRLPSEENFLRF